MGHDAAAGSASRVLTVNNLAPVVRILPGATNSLSGIQLVSEVTEVSEVITATKVTEVTKGIALARQNLLR